MNRIISIVIATLLLVTSQGYSQRITNFGATINFNMTRKEHSLLVTYGAGKDFQALGGAIQWTINEKPIVFKVDPEFDPPGSRYVISADDYTLSSDEIQMLRRGLNIITSILKHDKDQMKETGFSFTTRDNTLMLNIKTVQGNGAVLGITLSEWIVNRVPFEFKSDDTGRIFINNALSDDEKKLLEMGVLLIIKQLLEKL